MTYEPLSRRPSYYTLFESQLFTFLYLTIILIHLLRIKPFTIHLLSLYLVQFQLCSIINYYINAIFFRLLNKQVLPVIISYTLVSWTSSSSILSY